MNWSFSQVSWNWPFHSKKDLLHLNPPRAPTFPASSKSSYKATHPCVQTCWPEITSWSFHDGSTWIQGGVTSGSPAVAHRTLHSSEGSGDMERVSPGLRSVWDKRRGEGGGWGWDGKSGEEGWVPSLRIPGFPPDETLQQEDRTLSLHDHLHVFQNSLLCTCDRSTPTLSGSSEARCEGLFHFPVLEIHEDFLPKENGKTGRLVMFPHERRRDCSLCALQRAALSAWNAFQPNHPRFCFKVTSSREPALTSPRGPPGTHLYCCTTRLQPSGGSTGLRLRAS